MMGQDVHLLHVIQLGLGPSGRGAGAIILAADKVVGELSLRVREAVSRTGLTVCGPRSCCPLLFSSRKGACD